MKMRRLAALALGTTCLLYAAEEGTRKVQVSKTDVTEFPSGGVLHLKNSFGKVTIEGWDGTNVEVTTIKSGSASHELDKVGIATERHGDEVLVMTTLPQNRRFPPPWPWKRAMSVYLDYRIKVPRDARLIVDHQAGEVNVDEVTGDIQVTVMKGGMTLRLPQNEQYVIDAKSDVGGVVSDFAGRTQRRPWLIGHQFAGEASAGAHKLYLRAGYGDIIILKIRKPPLLLRWGQQ